MMNYEARLNILPMEALCFTGFLIFTSEWECGGIDGENLSFEEKPVSPAAYFSLGKKFSI